MQHRRRRDWVLHCSDPEARDDLLCRLVSAASRPTKQKSPGSYIGVVSFRGSLATLCCEGEDCRRRYSTPPSAHCSSRFVGPVPQLVWQRCGQEGFAQLPRAPLRTHVSWRESLYAPYALDIRLEVEPPCRRWNKAFARFHSGRLWILLRLVLASANNQQQDSDSWQRSHRPDFLQSRCLHRPAAKSLCPEQDTQWARHRLKNQYCYSRHKSSADRFR